MKKRNRNLDFIRAFACYSVICFHFFLWTKFYETSLIGKKMYLALFMRNFFMICVPLFMVLSGYLLKNKKIEKEYYRKIINILISYVIIGFVTLLFKKYVLNVDLDFKNIILCILGFNISYEWYIKMYIGLFLLAPFLNLIYNNLKTKREKQILISTFIFLIVLPTFTNIWNFNVKNFFLHPSITREYNPLLPSWWSNIYPVMYYFIGCYLNEYKIKLNVKKNIGLISLSLFIFTVFSLYRSGSGTLILDSYTNEWYGFVPFTLTILVFILFLNLNFNGIPSFIYKIINKIAEVSLHVYLISYIFDQIIYGMLLNPRVPDARNRIYLFLPATLSVFILSFVAAIIVNQIVKIIMKRGLKYEK